MTSPTGIRATLVAIIALNGTMFPAHVHGNEGGALCVRATREHGPLGGLRVRDACRQNEVEVASLEQLRAFRTGPPRAQGSATLRLTDGLELLSPIGPASDDLDTPSVAEPQEENAVPGTNEASHFCRKGGFPGEVGDKFSCTTDADCDGICVAGEDSVLGGAGGYRCTTNGQCNTALHQDGVCSTDANCTAFAILSIRGNRIIFSGFNVVITNGTGSTETSNGLGNLVVGYNEGYCALDHSPCTQRGSICGYHGGSPFYCQVPRRTGSHNIVVGYGNGYTSVGGLVVGRLNVLKSPEFSVNLTPSA